MSYAGFDPRIHQSSKGFMRSRGIAGGSGANTRVTLLPGNDACAFQCSDAVRSTKDWVVSVAVADPVKRSD
jgi:hypothetical protein